jgi:hypothetical protein
MEPITTVRIHPALGIARLGNHPTDYFIGPERPYDTTPPEGGYKSQHAGTRKIKRQAARFRLFGYDANNRLVREITAADAAIEWTVHLANTKASWQEFKELSRDEPLRNRTYTPARERGRLNIDPGPRKVSGLKDKARFDNGQFTEWKAAGSRTLTDIYLGEIRTDPVGRLLVLGGHGKSASPWQTPITHSFNNDGWHDDIADGSVDATVTLKSGQTFSAVGAWVICAPPNFAPPIGNLVTLHDSLYQKFVTNGQYDTFVAQNLLDPRRDPPSWRYDVYPLLNRIYNVQWVVDLGTRHQGLNDILDRDLNSFSRLIVFNTLKSPDGAASGNMPRLFGDVVPSKGPIEQSLTLTAVQYQVIRDWKDERVNTAGEHGSPSSPDNREITPQGLDRAALEHVVGGGFHPGIEAGWMIRDIFHCDEPFRLSRQQDLRPGDVTKQMAVPWQTDFYKCIKLVRDGSIYGFWPGARPNDVVPEGENDSVRRPWEEGLVKNMVEMIDKWSELGFVVEVSRAPNPRYTETERNEQPSVV